MCKPKKEGGLGVVDLRCLNNALLSKWLWYTIKRHSLVGSLLHALYKRRHSTIQSSTPSPSNSFFWNNIIHNKEPFISSIKWKIGDGSSTRFWEDKWTGNNTLKSVFPHAYSLALSHEVPVSSQGFLHNGNWTWQPTRRRATLENQCRDKHNLMMFLSSFRVSITPDSMDSPTWSLSDPGEFSVNSLYKFTSRGGVLSPNYPLIWKSVYPSKVKIFTWLLSLNKLNTKANLYKKGWQGNLECVLCLKEVEDSDHLFFTCDFSATIWSFMRENFDHNGWPNSIHELFHSKGQFITNSRQRFIGKALFPIVCWCIWHARNNKIFHNQSPSVKNIINSVAHYVNEWT